MSIKRRDFLRMSAGKATLGTALIYGLSSYTVQGETPKTGTLLDDLRPMTDDVAPITLQERLARVDKAQKLMVDNKIEALLLDSGTSLTYFTGISWWPSERTMVAIIPAKGDVRYI